MGIDLIYAGRATLEDMYVLYKLGIEFVIEDGQVTGVIERKG